jgi:hypothetical protein
MRSPMRAALADSARYGIPGPAGQLTDGRPGLGQPGPGQPVPPPPITPPRVWLDHAQWPGRLYERLLEQRIVMASGHLDDVAATRLSAQLLTLDAEGDDPIRLELQGLDADLPGGRADTARAGRLLARRTGAGLR